MLGKLFGGGDPVKAFWDWVDKNQQRLLQIETGQEPVVAEFLSRLRKVHPQLTYQAGPVENGRRELVISADGIRELFPVVQQVVAAAPELEGLTIVAFRQPVDIDTITLNDVTLSKSQINFRAEPDGEKFAIELFIEGLTESQRNEYSHAAFMLLDFTIGEYAVEERLSYIDFEALASYSGGEPLKPLDELPELLGIGSPS